MPPFFRGNPMFFLIMGIVLLLQILLVQFGGSVFSTVPLSAMQWLTIIIASASVLGVGFLLRVSFRYLENANKA